MKTRKYEAEVKRLFARLWNMEPLFNGELNGLYRKMLEALSGFVDALREGDEERALLDEDRFNRAAKRLMQYSDSDVVTEIVLSVRGAMQEIETMYGSEDEYTSQDALMRLRDYIDDLKELNSRLIGNQSDEILADAEKVLGDLRRLARRYARERWFGYFTSILKVLSSFVEFLDGGADETDLYRATRDVLLDDKRIRSSIGKRLRSENKRLWKSVEKEMELRNVLVSLIKRFVNDPHDERVARRLSVMLRGLLKVYRRFWGNIARELMDADVDALF